MKAVDLLSVAIIADWWITAKTSESPVLKKAFEKELKAAKELRKIASKMNDEAEVYIDEMPF